MFPFANSLNKMSKLIMGSIQAKHAIFLIEQHYVTHEYYDILPNNFISHAQSQGQNAILNVLESFPFSSANLINTMMGMKQPT